MSKSKETVVLGAALLLSLQCQLSIANVIGIGACPTLNPTFTTTDDPFVTGAVGATTLPVTNTWYLHRRYPSSHGGLTCVTFATSTSSIAAPYTNAVTITGRKPITRTQVTITGTVTQRAAASFYSWTSSFTNTGSQTISHLPSSLVVAAYDTTNGNYLVLFACTNYGLFNKQYSWVLTKSQSNSDTNIAAALNAASLAGVPTSKYVLVDQNYC